MSNTTRLILNDKEKKQDIDSVVNLILAKNNRVFHEADKEDRALYKNVSINTKTQGKENFAGKEIPYYSLSITYDKVTPKIDESASDDETARTSFDNNNLLIIYTFEGKIYFIIDQNTGASTFIKTLLGENKRGYVKKVKNNISSDLILWLISKVYSQNSEYADSEKVLSINTITGFKGITEDSLSTVSASGDTVMNILSTLSFLLETRSLKMIRLELEYADYGDIALNIGTNDTINIEFSKYFGSWLGDTNIKEKLSLLVYVEIIPTLCLWYNSAIDDDSDDAWGPEQNKKFLEIVGSDLSEKVQAKIDNFKVVTSSKE